MADLDTSRGAVGDEPGGDEPGDGVSRTASASARTALPPTSADVPAAKLTRRGRVRKWDRPRAPRDWRWFVGNVGKILISVGLLMFGFVAYQLYGTGIQTAAAQNRLETEFEELLAESTPITPPATTVPAAPVETAPATTAPAPPTTAVPVPNQNLLQVENGDALARIEIPAIGVDDIVVAGVEKSDLQKGPGHFPETPLPGQFGNAAIAGHRTTYGQPFRHVDDLVPGDEIRVTTLSGTYVYSVTGTQIVNPSYYQAVVTTDPTTANLTLTSCHPVFSARERIVISSELVPSESSPVGEPVINYGRPVDPSTDATSTDEIAADDDPTLQTTPAPDAAPVPDDSSAVTSAVTSAVDESPTTESEAEGGATGAPVADEPGTDRPDGGDQVAGGDQFDTEAVNEGIADAFSDGWFSDPAANTQVALWGLAVSAIAIGAYLVSRRFRRDWAGLLIGIVPFSVALYFFFENANRLLPPNL